MKNAPLQGTRDEKRTGLFFESWEQWSSLFRRCNWYDFTLIDVSVEFAPYTGRWEFMLGILGLNCRLTWVYDGSFNAKMGAIRDEIAREQAAEGSTDQQHGDAP